MSLARRAWGASVALVAAVVLLLACGAPAGRAGVWAQIACVNPNGSAATSAGWSAFTSADPYGSTADSTCAPGSPMSAVLGDALPAPVFMSAGLVYTPPAGSTLVGGTVQVVLSADGNGTGATADAEIDEPAQTSADARLRCTAGSHACGSSATDYSGTFTLPSNLGGNLYVTAACNGTGGESCENGAHNNTWAFAQVSAAKLLLQNIASPTARAITGALIAHHPVHGTAGLRLTASDPAGPGVYRIAVTIDGRTVHNATPSRNGGACVPVGTDAITGALEFDAAQPCPNVVSAALHIPTANLPDGSHQLAVTVTDAAGNTSTVLRRTITTDNPQLTPRPVSGVRAQFAISWRWGQTATELRTISASHLPSSDKLALSCKGKGCPSLPSGAASGAAVAGLLRGLRGINFAPGDALRITVSAPHRTAERIELTIRHGARPRAKLLG